MTAPRRNLAFDNLRALMVLFIVLLHAACAYAMGTRWWHAQDTKSMIFDITIVAIDTFALPVLFFIAGLFAHPSYERYGAAGFIRTKLKRLGIPLLAISVFHIPLMVYVGYVRRAVTPSGFFEYWLNWMASFGDWSWTVITDMKQGARYADAMSPHHLWFISLLLIFFLGYAACRTVCNTKSEPGMQKLTCLATLGVFIGFTALNLTVQDWAWARFGPFILFQPTRIAVYLGLFVFGVFARTKMERLRPFPGPWWGWMILFLAALVTLITMVQALMAPGPAPLYLALIHGSLRAVLAVAACGLLFNLGMLHFNTPSTWHASLAASSYDIYLWHMPLVVFIQATLVETGIPLGVKVLTAFLTATMLFWSMSRMAARLGPWLWTGYMGVLFLGFCLGTG